MACTTDCCEKSCIVVFMPAWAQVKCLGRDTKGLPRLSRKALLPPPPPEPRAKSQKAAEDSELLLKAEETSVIVSGQPSGTGREPEDVQGTSTVSSSSSGGMSSVVAGGQSAAESSSGRQQGGPDPDPSRSPTLAELLFGGGPKQVRRKGGWEKCAVR